MKIKKDDLRELFKNNYERESWMQLLHQLFQDRVEFAAHPEENKTSDGKSITHLGIVSTYDEIPRRLGIYEVKVDAKTRLARNRVQMRKIVADDCRKRSLDGALSVYFEEKGDIWRFSFVSMENEFQEDGKLIKKETSPKRYTYILGKDAHIRTVVDRFASLSSKICIDNLITAFAVEQLNKEFYADLFKWYENAKDKVEFPNDEDCDEAEHAATSLIRLITRLLFVWFIKEKGLINTNFFDRDELKKIITWDKPSSYYKAILQNLFFATLNRRIEDREFRTRYNSERNSPGGDIGQDRLYSDNYGIYTLYRYRDFFQHDNDQDIIELFSRTPFLNGGLFDCLDRQATEEEAKYLKKSKADSKDYRIIRIDGFSDRKMNALHIPNELFFSDDDSQDGIIDVLSRYQFTVEESTPLDMDVALDPELMGLIFENLLAAYNPETKEDVTNTRKSTGSYYTPRRVVSFMVDESLKGYLWNSLGNDEGSKTKLEALFQAGVNEFTEEEIEKIISAIDSLRVIDPAVGSGAFPMGVLHRLTELLQILDPENKVYKQRQIDSISTEYPQVRRAMIENIEKEFLKDNQNYCRKLFLIEKVLFGVDIQPIACQIAKLRFFISLAIEQEITKDKSDNYGLEALPNLETRFVSADTLKKLDSLSEQSLDRASIEDTLGSLKNIRQKHFSAKTTMEKRKFKSEDEELRKALAEILRENNLKTEDADKIAKWDPYDQSSSADWFDPEYMFGLSEGFDIVIGNPPYISLQKKWTDQESLAKKYKGYGYKTFAGRGDIYALFCERGLELLRDGGHLCFITSNKWLRTSYGGELRSYFGQYSPKFVIDLVGCEVFQASVDPSIFLIKRVFLSKKKLDSFFGIAIDDLDMLDASLLSRSDSFTFANLSPQLWFIGSSKEASLFRKIEEIGTPLKDKAWGISIYRGIITGLNEAFIIDNDTRNSIIAENQQAEEIIRPLLKGEDIERYHVNWDGKWLIDTHNGYDEVPAVDISKYPSVRNYLDNFLDKLERRQDKGYTPYNLRSCAYYPEFMQDKIVYSEIVQKPQFFLDKENYFAEATTFILTGESLEYLECLLNSTPVAYFFKKFYSGGGLGTKGYRYKKTYINNLPLPRASVENTKIIDDILKNREQIRKCQAKDIDIYQHNIDDLVCQLYSLSTDEVKLTKSFDS